MHKAIIRLTSVTYALRAQKLLEQKGIRTTVKRLARNLHVNGCGYGVEIDGRNLETARQILNTAGIRIIEITA